MGEPTLTEGVQLSRRIVVATYLSCQPEAAGYLEGVPAHYVVTRVLKGDLKPQEPLRIIYSFHDGTACLAPPDWTFQPRFMPKTGSEWILLLPTDRSYRGDFGRLPFTKKNFAKIEALLSRGGSRHI